MPVISQRIAALLGAVCLSGIATLAAAPFAQVVTRPVSPQDIKNLNLAVTGQVMKSAGIGAVAIGTPAYLEVQVTNLVVTQVTWAITARPALSTTNFDSSPLTNLTVTPIADYGQRLKYFVPTNTGVGTALQGRVVLKPDWAGQYRIVATVRGLSGAVSVAVSATGIVTGARWTGEDGACTYCHGTGLVASNDNVNPWLQTGHATFFTRAIDGQESPTYKASCISCHTVGYDTNAFADNAGFDDIATNVQWSFPASLTNGNWAGIDGELKKKANIQCENCHGPSSAHQASGATNMISVTLSAGNCGQCHDSLNSHVRNFEWRQSAHATGDVFKSGGFCATCHSGRGFIDAVDGDGIATRATGDEGITCAVCHDSHSAENDYQLRTLDDVVLGPTNGPVAATISGGGTGKLCMQCHKSRYVNAAQYVTAYHPSFGPHEAPQADMLAGVNAIEYGGLTLEATGNPHMAVPDTCAYCHMQDLSSDTNYPGAFKYAQGHTFKMVWNNGGTNVDITSGCMPCHYSDYDGNRITNFAFSATGTDYDGDGYVEPVRDEIDDLLEELALLLPPIGTNSVQVTSSFTSNQLMAAYNYFFVRNDGSHGIHNPSYAAALLNASIEDILSAPPAPPVRRALVLQAPSSGKVQEWTLNTNAARTAVRNLFTGSTAWLLRGAGDIDRDGVADLIWQVGSGQVACWLMTTGGTARATVMPFVNPSAWVVRGVADVDEDGVADILWQSPSGRVGCSFMNPDATQRQFVTVSAAATTRLLRGAGDVNGDGAADLVWQTPAGQVYCSFLNTAGTILSTARIYAWTTTWVVRGVGDIDGDEIADLLWQSPTGRISCSFLRAGGSTRSSRPVWGTATSWQLRGVGIGY